MEGLLGHELGPISEDVYLEEVGCKLLVFSSPPRRSRSLFFPGHIQENLEDDIVREALKSGVDLRQYSKEIESELLDIERSSIRDCKILNIFSISTIYILEKGILLFDFQMSTRQVV